MTISTIISTVTAQGNGATTNFVFPFLIPAAADTQIIYTDPTGIQTTLKPTQYAIANLNNSAGGVVTYPLSGPPIPSGSLFTIQRILPLVQTTSVMESGPTFASIERQFDYDTMLLQQHQFSLDRTLQLNAADTMPMPELPPAAVRANRFLSFDNNGNPITTAFLAGTATVSSAMQSFINAASLFAARNQLGVAAFATPQQFGAVGDGVTDDSAAFQAAMNASGSVYLSPGVYIINSALNWNNQNISLIGAGQGITEMRFGAVGTGINISLSSNNYTVDIDSITFTTTGAAVGTAIAITWPGGPSFAGRYSTRGTITRCAFQGVTAATSGWKFGIVYTQAVTVHLAFCSFYGMDPSTGIQPPFPLSNAGVSFVGTFFPVSLTIVGCSFYTWDIGVSIQQSAQGVYSLASDYVFCRIGLDWETAGTGNPQLCFADCHANCYQSGVDIAGITQCFIHDSLFYAAANGLQDAALVDIGACNYINVHDNQFQSFAVAPRAANAIIVEATGRQSIIHHNLIESMSVGILLKAGSASNLVDTNYLIGPFAVAGILDPGGTGTIYGSATGCTISRSTPVSIPSSTNTPVPWDTTVYDPNLFWNGSGPFLIVPAGMGIKLVKVTAGVIFDASNQTGNRAIQLFHNGSLAPLGGGMSITPPGLSFLNLASGILSVGDGDTFETVLFQDSGVPLNASGSNLTWISIEVIG